MGKTLEVPLVCLQFAVFPDHTHLLFLVEIFVIVLMNGYIEISLAKRSALLNRKFHISQISHCEELRIGTNSSQRVKDWYQYVTYFVPIFHIL